MKALFRAAAAFAAALLLASAVFAEGSGAYFDDAAGIISSADAEAIGEVNDALFAMTGAEIAVKAVASAGGDLYTAAKDTMASVPIGSAERDNGMLLLISADDSGYWLMPASGLGGIIGDGEIAALCKGTLESGLASGDTSGAVLAFVTAMADELAGRYGVSLSAWDGVTYSFTRSETGSVYPSGMSPLFRRLLWCAVGVIVLVVLTIAVIILRPKISRERRRTTRTKKRKNKSTSLTFARGIYSRKK